MAVLDELITRLGFEVTGVEDLKQAKKEAEEVEKWFLKKKADGAWETNTPEARRARQKYWAELARDQKKAAKGQEGVTRALEKTGVITRKTGMMFRFLAAAGVLAIGGLVYGLAKVAAGLLSVGVAAAKARRELQVSAKAMGTTAQGMDVLTNFFSVFSIGRDAAQEWSKASVKAISEVVDAAKKGDAEAKKKLLGLGPGVAYTNGKLNDSSAIAYSATKRALQLREQAADLRKKGRTTRADKLENDASGILTNIGLSKEQQIQLFDSGIKSTELRAKTQEQSNLHPTWNTEQEERAARVAKKWNEVSDKFSAISDSIVMKFQQLGIGLADGILPVIDKILDAIIRFGKATGLLPETQQEKNERTQKNFDKTMGGNARANAAWSGGYKQDEKGNFVAEPISSGELLWKVLADQVTGGEKTGASRDVAGWDRVYAGYSPQEAGATSKTTEIVNSGNDQRQMPTTVNMSVTAGSLPEIVAAAVTAANKAVSIVKGNNASTASNTTP